MGFDTIEINLVSPIFRPWIEKLFNKIFTIFTKESKSSFTNRKWNYFSYFQTLDQKTSLTKHVLFLLRNLNPVLQTRNGIIYLIYIPQIKASLTKYLPFLLRSPILVLQIRNKLSKHEVELFLPYFRPWIKKLFLQNI